MDIKSPCNPINEKEFFLLNNYVLQSCGICIPFEKAYLFETRLSNIMLDAGAKSFGELYDILISDKDPSLHQKVINAITTNETLWFRDEFPWKYLEERILPVWVDELITGRKAKVRIWSAAVSTGQEIYSTVMCVDNYLQKNKVKGVTLSDFDFFATDISTDVLDTAKIGRYNKICMSRGLDDYYKKKYFTKDNAEWIIDPKIRDAVRFLHFNLTNDYKNFGLFDIIFCRYILIYFPDDTKKEVLSRMSDMLMDTGILFSGISIFSDLFEDSFHVNHSEEIIYYTKKTKPL